MRGMIRGLRPPYLDDLGLMTAVKILVDEKRTPNTEIELTQIGEDERLSAEVELELYRIIQEGITNSLKHAQARHIWIEISFLQNNVDLTIRDDGVGFNPPERLDQLAPLNKFGLLGMKERADRIGNAFILDTQPGHGTKIEVKVPLSQVRK